MQNDALEAAERLCWIKSVMLRQLVKLGTASREGWERAVSRALAGLEREGAGGGAGEAHPMPFLWIRGFDHLVSDLVKDGHVRECAGISGRAFAPSRVQAHSERQPLTSPGRFRARGIPGRTS